MQTAMILTKAWAAAAAGEPLAEPLIVEDRAAYLSRHLPVDGARGPGVRFLGPVELARSALYLAKDARRHRTLRVYFSDGEIARMRSQYGNGTRLTVNDVVCGHISEMLMDTDPAVGRRTLAIAVNARSGPLRRTLRHAQSGFGVYRIQFEGSRPSYCTPLITSPVAGLGALLEGADGGGLVFQIALPPKEFERMTGPTVREQIHRFRRPGDHIPELHRVLQD